jgi:hypothetical protein
MTDAKVLVNNLQAGSPKNILLIIREPIKYEWAGNNPGTLAVFIIHRRKPIMSPLHIRSTHNGLTAPQDSRTAGSNKDRNDIPVSWG